MEFNSGFKGLNLQEVAEKMRFDVLTDVFIKIENPFVRGVV